MIKATLIDHMGDDLRVVNAARVSFDKESEYQEITERRWEDDILLGPITYEHTLKVLSEKDQKLISYLARNGHWTPFSHPQITLREEVPIFVARQRFKHMVGFTYNEVSRRYVDDEPEFYFPESVRKRADSVKQGSSDDLVTSVEVWDSVVGPTGNVWDDPVNFIACFYDHAETAYRSLLKAGACPEQARMVLPQGMMTSYYVTGSLAAFARAYKQRSDSHSQAEIRELAKFWDQIIRPLFPVSWGALVD
jgi:thymidylate synthase (FAD)